MARRVVVGGAINTDLVVRTARFPEPGETVIGETFATFGGGKGANQAIAAARLGVPVAMVGAVGADAYGEERLADLVRDGVDVTWVARRDDLPSGVALIQVDASGQNAITIVPGANGSVDAAHVRDSLATSLRSDDIVCAQLELPIEAITAMVEVAQRAGAQFVLNAAPVIPGAADVLPALDTLIVNEIEAGQLLGTARVELADVADAARALTKLGPPTVVVTLGEHGAYIVGPGVSKGVPAPNAPVVDTTGAGDAFVGAYVACLSLGLPIAHAVEVGVQAGSLAVQRDGAQPSLPRRSELATLLDEPLTSRP